jgi:hypothetical protein
MRVRRRTRALFTAVAAAIVGAFAYVIGVGSLSGQAAEARVLDAARFTVNPPAPLSLVSIPTVSIALVVIVVLALWVHGVSRALTLLLSSSVALVASQLLKENVLERPELFELGAPNTFPSGHMTVFAVLVGALLWALPQGMRGLASVAGAVLLSIVSWQLLEYGWHRPSDVLGAQALVVLSFSVAAWLGPQRTRHTQRGTSSRLLSGTNSVLGIIMTISGVVIILGGVLLVAVAASVGSDELFLNAGEIALVGVSTLAARTFTRLAT